MRRVITSTLALSVVALTAACSDEPGQQDVARDESGAVVDGGEVGAFRLRVGDCFVEPSSMEQIESVEAVSCDELHMYEVYDRVEMDAGADDDYPGEAAVTDEAGERCLALFERFVGVGYEVSIYDISYVYPTELTWTQVDDREILCMVMHYDGTTKTGSAKGTAE